MSERKLTEKERLFVLEYLVDLNGAAAARRAGYSEKTARTMANELLGKPHIVAAVQERMNKRAEKVGVNAETVLKELLRIATVDIAGAFDDKGDLLPVKDMPEDVRRAVAGVEVDAIFEGYGEEREQIGQNKKIKFWDKTKALDSLGRHLKLFTDKIEVSGIEELASAMAKARERAKKD